MLMLQEIHKFICQIKKQMATKVKRCHLLFLQKKTTIIDCGEEYNIHRHTQTYKDLVYSDDDFETHQIFHTFNENVIAVHVHKIKLIIGTNDGKIFVGDKDSGGFVEKLTCSAGRYVVNSWGISSKDNNIFISEYGQWQHLDYGIL